MVTAGEQPSKMVLIVKTSCSKPSDVRLLGFNYSGISRRSYGANSIGNSMPDTQSQLDDAPES
jgi:hypothetical protein